jgi:hypothetical protein
MHADAVHRLPVLFRKIKTLFEKRTSPRRELLCKEGFYKIVSVSKLQKAHQTNESSIQDG